MIAASLNRWGLSPTLTSIPTLGAAVATVDHQAPEPAVRRYTLGFAGCSRILRDVCWAGALTPYA